MQTLTVQGEVDSDGTLRLEVPCALPPGPVEVVVVLNGTKPNGPLSHDTLSGLFAGQLPDLDIDAALRGMNKEWERSLLPPE
jgi:hypothetical protein